MVHEVQVQNDEGKQRQAEEPIAEREKIHCETGDCERDEEQGDDKPWRPNSFREQAISSYQAHNGRQGDVRRVTGERQQRQQ